MRTRHLVPAVVLSTVALGACGGDDDPTSEGPDGPAATFTASATGCSVATDGFVYDPGEIEVGFVNDHTDAVTMELLGEGGDVVTSADLPAGESGEEVVQLGAGDYTVRCSDGTLTWESTGEGETPDGIIVTGAPYTVGE